VANIHSSAIIDPGALLASDVEVGPYAVIGANVEIGSGSRLGAHTVISGHTSIGRDNHIFQFASIGAEPQDKKYAGEPTRLEIGDRNTIREFCTFNCGTVQDAGATRLGNDNWMMAYVHLAHDCQIGNNTIFANNSQLAGHVHVGDYAILGGFTAVHQYCRIGAHSITAIGTVVLQDIPTFVTASGNTAQPYGINSEGLKRRGYAAATITRIKRAYKTLYKSGLGLEDARRDIASMTLECPELQLLADFLGTTTRGIIR
jgi:UDP-N-acetylglucosamine acyltransferase